MSTKYKLTIDLNDIEEAIAILERSIALKSCLSHDESQYWGALVQNKAGELCGVIRSLRNLSSQEELELVEKVKDVEVKLRENGIVVREDISDMVQEVIFRNLVQSQWRTVRRGSCRVGVGLGEGGFACETQLLATTMDFELLGG